MAVDAAGRLGPTAAEAGTTSFRAGSGPSRLPAAVAVAASAALLLADRLPRFFHEDLTAYLVTGPLDWGAPGRSWAYGHAARFLTAATGSPAAVPVAASVPAVPVAAPRPVVSVAAAVAAVAAVVPVPARRVPSGVPAVAA